MQNKKYQAGHWLGLGIGIGVAAGLIADVILATLIHIENLWFGAASTAAIAIGTIAGSVIEIRNKHLRKAMSAAEQEKYKSTLFLTYTSIAMLVFVSVFLYLKKMQA